MANRFAVGLTGTVTDIMTNTAWWSATTGGAGGASVPGPSDAVIFDASSGGGGTAVVNWEAGSYSFQQFTCGAWPGTLDLSVNNPNLTITGVSTSAFSATGSATRTLRMGSGTLTIEATALATVLNFASVAGLTFSGASCNVVLQGTNNGRRTVTPGAGLTWGNFTFGGGGAGVYAIVGNSTFNNIIIDCVTSAKAVLFATGTSVINGSIQILNSAIGRMAQISANSDTAVISFTHAAAAALAFVVLRQVTFTGAGAKTATDSIDLGLNTGITITAPTLGGGGTAGPLVGGSLVA